MMAAYGLGGLLGIALLGGLAERVSRWLLYVALTFVYPVVSFGLVPLPPLAPTLVTLLLIGIVAGAAVPLYQTVRQERTPAELRGRVFATAAAAESLAIPPAVLLAGYVVETFGLQAALLVFAAGNAFYGLLKLTLPGAEEIAPRYGGAGARSRRHPLTRRPVGRRWRADDRARHRALP